MSHKVIIVGPKVGKTTFIRRIVGKSTKNVMPTKGCDIYSHKEFDFYDCGSEYNVIDDAYYIGAECAVIIAPDIKVGKRYLRKVLRVCPNIPRVYLPADILSDVKKDQFFHILNKKMGY